jgi:hypothetical protein
MAPEWTQFIETNFESLKRLDIYALGIILADLVCNPATAMETMRIDDSLKSVPP